MRYDLTGKKKRPPPPRSFRRRAACAVIFVLLGAAVGLCVAEVVLRARKSYLLKSNQLDAGLCIYDKRLGWRLSRNWLGRHRHHDFNVLYTTDLHGFRTSRHDRRDPDHELYAVVGDSFVFGMGVNDGETFVDCLNRCDPPAGAFLNAGVPGFSTDQEYLLIRDEILDLRPDVILLAVCLINDFLDNERSVPHQFACHKPHFEMIDGELTLKPPPVPGPDPLRLSGDLFDHLYSVPNSSVGKVVWCVLNRSQLYRSLGRKPPDGDKLRIRMQSEYAGCIALFGSILEGVQQACGERGARLELILLPGRLCVVLPDSLPGQAQAFFRTAATQECARLGIPVHDVTLALQRRYEAEPGKWYYPNEGHMTPEGHRVVAEILTRMLGDDDV